ncbi:MAG: hypothetical protein V4723_08790 [Pseudomonadota bacterium]
MEDHIRIRIPAHIRSILIEWGSAWDPALIPIGNHDRQSVAALYRGLGRYAGQVTLARGTIRSMYLNARMNSRFGLVAEVRREGATLVQWIEALMARDPVLASLVEAPAVAYAEHGDTAASISD